MKTLVFHSVKGGVGRTLALCNVAKALAETGRKVLMLDFDYLAPGLHHKWNKPSGCGYLEYLEHFSIEDRAGGKSAADRWHELGRNIKRVGKNLYLLRAGDETRGPIGSSSHPISSTGCSIRQDPRSSDSTPAPSRWSGWT